MLKFPFYQVYIGLLQFMSGGIGFVVLANDLEYEICS